MNIEHYTLVMDYIKDIFEFRKTINHKLTNYEIKRLIKQLNYNLNTEDEDFESYYSGRESEILTDFDEDLMHFCMVRSGFKAIHETNFFKYNVAIKKKLKRLIKMHGE